MNFRNKYKGLLSIVFGLISLLTYGQQDTLSFVFIGHCYQINTVGDKVDFRVEALDLSEFSGVWLGGDVCSEAMLNYTTVQYIDTLFDLGNPNTHWALGNHDARNGNWEWYEEFTGRETYYSYASHGITRIIMNSNLLPTNCEMLEEQFKIITKVCDTISESSDLVLLMHHGLWRDIPNLPSPGVYGQSDLRYWNANCDSVNTQFVDVIYPKLIEVKQRGVHVTCVMGDMGVSYKKFDMFSTDSIRFMGCGLYYNEPDDNILIIEKSNTNSPLRFTFHNLDSLLNTQIQY
jgi:hypothetical protein